MLEVLAISNYRSIREMVLSLSRLNLVTGANGSGKSNLYRALRLLAELAEGQAVSSLAREGGLASAMWAGPKMISPRMKRGEVPIQGATSGPRSVLRVGFLDDDLGYAAEIGLPVPERPPPPRPTRFALDPEIKHESIFGLPRWSRRSAFVERTRALVEARGSKGAWEIVTDRLWPTESMLTYTADPRTAPETVAIRQRIQSWRFYDHFRADRDAPARALSIGTRTMLLHHDGRDVAAALETILEIGDAEGLAESLDEAFPGATLDVDNVDGRFHIRFREAGLLRALSQEELSDGTLRYLLWLAALHTPRPPPLIILNEPETSLHVQLHEPLARLIARASKRSQVIVVSHSPTLISLLGAEDDCRLITLRKELGETLAPDPGLLHQPDWKWPTS